MTPAFKNKDVINFYEDVSDDISMLKDMISNRSKENLLNQTDNTNKVQTPFTPVKGSAANCEKSTECANTSLPAK